jgi:hypothetical protein
MDGALKSAFFVNTKGSNPTDALAGDDNSGSKVAAFMTEQSIANFAATSGTVRLVWFAFQKAGGKFFDSPWFGLLLCVGVGAIMVVISLADNTALRGWKLVKAIAFAIINTFLLWAAALGIDDAAQKVVPGGADPGSPAA